MCGGDRGCVVVIEDVWRRRVTMTPCIGVCVQAQVGQKLKHLGCAVRECWCGLRWHHCARAKAVPVVMFIVVQAMDRVAISRCCPTRSSPVSECCVRPLLCRSNGIFVSLHFPWTGAGRDSTQT